MHQRCTPEVALETWSPQLDEMLHGSSSDACYRNRTVLYVGVGVGGPASAFSCACGTESTPMHSQRLSRVVLHVAQSSKGGLPLTYIFLAYFLLWRVRVRVGLCVDCPLYYGIAPASWSSAYFRSAPMPVYFVQARRVGVTPDSHAAAVEPSTVVLCTTGSSRLRKRAPRKAWRTALQKTLGGACRSFRLTRC